MAAVHRVQQRARAVIARQRHRHVDAHLLDERGANEQRAHLRLEARKHFPGQVVEQQLGRGSRGGQPGAAAALLQGENQRCGPTVGALVDGAQGCVGNAIEVCPDDGVGLFPAQAQRVPVQHLHLPVGAQPDESRRRWRAAEHHHAALCRHLGERLTNHVVHGTVGSQLVVVVEHQQERRLQRFEEAAKIVPGEGSGLGLILGREQRQAARAGIAVTAHALAQVQAKGGGIGVAGVHLVPDAVTGPCVEVAGHQAGLAASRRSVHPQQRRPPRRVQRCEQPLARQHVAGARPRGLGGGCAADQSPPP